ncbi:hypothetical protein FRC03_010823 [Tulasnella sp. 419]|nr:hypothetical protein FRC02_000742 [Tulasnella sp. 418]KAG8956473.1 hypothetical protein FRC03_010823 [Tulasnella sp. 419]
MAFTTLVILVSVLGVSSFLAGMIPLSVAMSRKRLAQISTVGTGILLGAAMGVIIPEGVETIYESSKSDKAGSKASPHVLIATSLLGGFTLMLLLEQLLSHLLSSPRASKYTLANSHPTPGRSVLPLSPTSRDPPTSGSHHDTDVDPDLELEMELNAMGVGDETPVKNPNMLTLGLVIHSLADGLALGAANAVADTATTGLATGDSTTQDAGASWVSDATGVSIIVFLAIAMHKAPTALALTSTLLPQLTTRQARQHLIAFSLASPLAALFTYLCLRFLGPSQMLGDWTGVVLMFSGGTFLYVATLLSPLQSGGHSDGAHLEPSSAELSPKVRTVLVVLGMWIPVGLGRLFGGHHH